MQNAANTTSAAAPDAAAAPAVILCVDDEANILAALTRLLSRAGHRVLTAPGGAGGIKILEKEVCDVIVSDMRMPEMDGATFLARAKAVQPDAVRLLLTGYSDLDSVISAVNEGGIYRYISKPWDDHDLALTVGGAIEMRLLRRERLRLEELTQRQNEELKSLNAELDNKVKARTGELQQLFDFVNAAHDDLKKAYASSVRVFANLIELRAGPLAGHARRVAEHAVALARDSGLTEAETTTLHYAALLHDVGKLGLSDALLHKPYNSLTAEERAQVMKHPVMGEAALLELEPLANAAHLIRHHHERFDGEGYPDRLAGEKIPLAARILAVVNEYDALLIGSLAPHRMAPKEAQQFLLENKGKRYDPKVVDAFLAFLGDPSKQNQGSAERILKTRNLAPGLVLARDLITRDGLVLLHAGRKLDASVIRRLQEIERTVGTALNVYVRA
jgi:response regulator RpfG family c-di-GMP phosphodiesterase